MRKRGWYRWALNGEREELDKESAERPRLTLWP